MRKLPSINEIELITNIKDGVLDKPSELQEYLVRFEFTTKTIEIALDMLTKAQSNHQKSLSILGKELIRRKTTN